MLTHSTVDFDLPCISCQYNLRMQPKDGRCPECGTSVPETLSRSPYLWNPRHIRKIVTASLMLASAGPIPFLGVIAAFLIRRSSNEPAAAAVLMLLAIGATWVTHFSGAWSMRQLALDEDRWDILIPVGGAAGTFVLGPIILTGAATSQNMVIVLLCVSLVSMLPAGGYFVALGRLVGRLCDQSGCNGVSKAIRWTLVPQGIALMLFSLSYGCWLILRANEGRGVLSFLTALGFWIGAIGFVISWVAAIIPLTWMHLRFAAIAKASAARRHQLQ